MTSISVIGAGAWGTALAMTAERANLKVTLWGWEHEETNALIERRECPRLPGIALPSSIKVTKDIKVASKANIILLAVPAQVTRNVAQDLTQYLKNETYIVNCSKGIELKTGSLIHQILEEILPNHSISALSGPTFASEVAENLPTAATIANSEITTSRWLASSLSSETFKLFPSNDVLGVELCGALKNVVAIAAGIVAARNLGDSASSSLIARGLKEIAQLGLAMGAKEESFRSLAAVGDIFMTSTSQQSRNMSLGYRLGSLKPKEALDQNTLTEGAYTVKPALDLAHQYGVEMPICSAVYNILYGGSSVDQEIQGLLGCSSRNATTK